MTAIRQEMNAILFTRACCSLWDSFDTSTFSNRFVLLIFIHLFCIIIWCFRHLCFHRFQINVPIVFCQAFPHALIVLFIANTCLQCYTFISFYQKGASYMNQFHSYSEKVIHKIITDIKQYYILLLCLITYITLGAIFKFTICPVRLLTGIPCPGCGITRSLRELLHGHFAEAFRLHPFIYIIILG